MNLTPAFFLSALAEYWYVFVIIIFIGFLKSPFFKGFLGEIIINITTSLFLDKKKYHLIKNITLPTDDGTTQIDHVIVSQYGIFVVETKNMNGWIFGCRDKKMWTQTIFKHKTRFQNPLHQNYKHIKTLEKLLDISSEKFFSLIVFVGDATFKTPMPPNVTYPRGYIKFINSQKNTLLSETEVRKTIEMIKSGRLERSLKTHREHVQHVKKIAREKRTG